MKIYEDTISSEFNPGIVYLGNDIKCSVEVKCKLVGIIQ